MSDLLNPSDFQRICARIRTLSPTSQAMWGVMNVAQMLPHCTDPIRLSKGELPARDISNWFSRNVMRHLVLWGMPAPKGKVKTIKEFDVQRLGTQPTEFEADRQTLLQYVEWLHGQKDQSSLAPHPFFGPMGKTGWSVLTFTHLDHHLKQFGV